MLVFIYGIKVSTSYSPGYMVTVSKNENLGSVQILVKALTTRHKVLMTVLLEDNIAHETVVFTVQLILMHRSSTLRKKVTCYLDMLIKNTAKFL